MSYTLTQLKKDLGFEEEVFPSLLKMPNVLQKGEEKVRSDEVRRGGEYLYVLEYSIGTSCTYNVRKKY